MCINSSTVKAWELEEEGVVVKIFCTDQSDQSWKIPWTQAISQWTSILAIL